MKNYFTLGKGNVIEFPRWSLC